MSANQIRLLVQKRKEESEVQKEEIKDAIIDYRLGVMDPAREAGRIEKQANIKKYVGKKLQYKKLFN